LVRGLFESGLSVKDVRELFRLIDWMMELPPALDDVFWQELDKIQEEKRMPFVTRIERVGRREGIREGIETALKIRFGEAGLQLMPEIREIHDEDKLRAILKALETAATPDEVRRLWSPADQ
jgi:hypothetical protein